MLAELEQLFSQQPFIFYGITIALGLTIGSFLNVGIYRLPIMLQKEWQQEAKSILDIDDNTPSDTSIFNLFWPRSKCPHCQQQLKAWHNIPIFSFLFLKGNVPIL